MARGPATPLRVGATSRGLPPVTNTAALLTAATVMIGMAGHTAAGGSFEWIAVLATALPLLAISRGVSRGEMTSGLLTALVVGGQAWLHLIASFCGHSVEPPSTRMWVGHGLASIITIVALRWREALTWIRIRALSTIAWIRTLLGRGRLRPSAFVALWRDASAPAFTPVVRICQSHRVPSRRGPPALLAA